MERDALRFACRLIALVERGVERHWGPAIEGYWNGYLPEEEMQLPTSFRCNDSVSFHNGTLL